MHFSKLQQQDQIQNTNNATSSPANERVSSDKITPTIDTSKIDRFTGSGASCTSSTDSGVQISDTEAVAGAGAASATATTTTTKTSNPLRVQFHKNINNSSNVDKNIDNSTAGRAENDVTGAKIARIFDNKFKNQQQLKNSSSNDNYNHQKPIQVENVINNSHQATQLKNTELETVTNPANRCEGATSTPQNEFNDHIRTASPAPSSPVYSSDSSDDELPSRRQHFNRSPAVSIRSINSSVIDSDSDSDLNGAIEGVHENYVIKKLGTQVSYPPQHPDIPKIHNGLQVINHQMTPNGMGPNGRAPPSPLAVLSAMGDNLSSLTSRGAVGGQGVSNMPQIAVSASKDITIGDKYFYEGPVTIQQFLIDSRDKGKESNGKDNPNFQEGSGDTCNNAKDINSPAAELSGKSYAKLLKNKKYIIPGVLVVLALVVLSIVLGIEAANDGKNGTNSNPSNPVETEDVECVEGQLCLVDRDMWRANAQTAKLDPQTLPLHRVVIGHTASEPCNSLMTCRDRVRVIQEFHMKSFGWDDIGYNFLVSSDGRVYVGRGWDDIGAHTKGYNKDSVGIAFIGTYTTTKPTEAQLNACRLLIDEGVRLEKLVPSYNLYGARQLSATESPGDALFKIIKTWDHWSAKV